MVLNCEPEGRPLTRFPFGPYPAAMAPEDPLHRGQADAAPSAFFGAGKALEYAKTDLLAIYRGAMTKQFVGAEDGCLPARQLVLLGPAGQEQLCQGGLPGGA